MLNRYGLIAVEDLKVGNRLKNHRLAGSISDAGWNLFVNILKAKAVEAGCRVVEVDPRNTSQICSGCGRIVPKLLSERWHSCPACGTSLHRDVNDAINILRRAAA
ncbi:MAG: RNA-guided endonuclease InsQ/TnpB family protein [Bacillota bacterium]